MVNELRIRDMKSACLLGLPSWAGLDYPAIGVQE